MELSFCCSDCVYICILLSEIKKKLNQLFLLTWLQHVAFYFMSSIDSISHKFVISSCSYFIVYTTIAGLNLHSCSWWAWYATMASITQRFSSTRRGTNGSTSTMQPSKRYIYFKTLGSCEDKSRRKY